MAQNSIGYTGRVVDRNGSLKVSQTANGMIVLNIGMIAEQHQMKMGAAKRDPHMKQYVEDERNASKGDDDWIDTTVSWHKLTVFGDKAGDLACNPEFNHGALIEIEGASYVEESPWKTKDDVLRAGRPETIGDKKGSVTIKFAPRDARPALWDGESALPKPGGGGGPAREISDNEGF